MVAVFALVVCRLSLSFSLLGTVVVVAVDWVSVVDAVKQQRQQQHPFLREGAL